MHSIAKSIINKTIDITGITLESMNLKDIEKFNKRQEYNVNVFILNLDTYKDGKKE